MKNKFKEKALSSPNLKNLQNELKKTQKAEYFLDKEKTKLIQFKEKIRTKIRKEKEVLRLKNKIRIVKNRK